MMSTLISHVQFSQNEVAELLDDLGYRHAAETVKSGNTDLVDTANTEARKMLRAMLIIQKVAKSLQEEFNLKDHFVAFALNGALKYWEQK